MSTQSEVDGNAKQRLLEAALALFAQRGLEGTTVRDIALKAGLNISLISYYFGGKEGLYRAILENHANHISDLAEEYVGMFKKMECTGETVKEFVRGLFDRMITEKVNSPDMALIIQREISGGLPHAREIHNTIFNKVGELVVSFLKEAQDKKIIREDINCHFLLISMVQVVDGYFMCHQANTVWMQHCYALPKNQNQYVQHISEIFIRGMIR